MHPYFALWLVSIFFKHPLSISLSVFDLSYWINWKKFEFIIYDLGYWYPQFVKMIMFLSFECIPEARRSHHLQQSPAFRSSFQWTTKTRNLKRRIFESAAVIFEMTLTDDPWCEFPAIQFCFSRVSNKVSKYSAFILYRDRKQKI